jgi:hypothetical protein
MAELPELPSTQDPGNPAGIICEFFFSYNSQVDWFFGWLHQSREDGRARLLFGSMPEYDSSIASFIAHVRKVCKRQYSKKE